MNLYDPRMDQFSELVLGVEHGPDCGLAYWNMETGKPYACSCGAYAKFEPIDHAAMAMVLEARDDTPWRTHARFKSILTEWIAKPEAAERFISAWECAPKIRSLFKRSP